MKSLDKMIKERLYAEVYEVLATDNFVYSYENLQKAFPKADSMQYYCFLMYSISKEETPEKHLAVCNLLAFGEPLLAYQSHSFSFSRIYTNKVVCSLYIFSLSRLSYKRRITL